MAAKQAMILAAGLGTRLRPYSFIRPKPLFPVLDHPLLALLISQLQQAGFDAITVNAHHLREQIASVVQRHDNVTLQEEEVILGTGGGLRRALEHFGTDPVLVSNGDIFHTIDIDQVYRAHCASGAQVTMVLHDFLRFNSVLVDDNERVAGFADSGTGNKTCRKLAFTGIHVINPAVLEKIPTDTFYNIIDCYRDLLKSGGSIQALVAQGHFWTDMGTVEDYLALHGALLTGKITHRLFAGEDLQSPLRIAGNARLGRNVVCQDWVSIGSGAIVRDDVKLSRVVIWDNAEVAAGSELNDTIVY